MEPRSDEGWNKSSFQHVCRPVIIDAEGRKQPIIRYTGTALAPHNTAESYVAKTETYVEHVQPPVLYTGQYSSSPTMVVLPPEDPYEFNKQQGQTLRSAVHNRPQKVEEFITKVQTETYTKPTRTSPFSTTTYRRPTGTGYNNNNNNGYGDYNDYNNNNNGVPYHRDEPSRAGYWSNPPNDQERQRTTTTTQLTKPTSDISAAIEYLKEAATNAKPFLGNNNSTTTTTTAATNFTRPRFTVGVPPRRSDSGSTTSTTTMETISSSEAKRRYGNAPSLPVASGETENYASTIDSREAMRRYKGRIV